MLNLSVSKFCTEIIYRNILEDSLILLLSANLSGNCTKISVLKLECVRRHKFCLSLHFIRLIRGLYAFIALQTDITAQRAQNLTLYYGCRKLGVDSMSWCVSCSKQSQIKGKAQPFVIRYVLRKFTCLHIKCCCSPASISALFIR